MKPIQKILVITAGEIIGDGFIKIPFIDALRRAHPEAQIFWYTKGTTVYATILKPVMDMYRITVCENHLPLKEADFSFDLILDTQKRFFRSLCYKLIPHKIFQSHAGGGRLANLPIQKPLPAHDLRRLFQLAALEEDPATLMRPRLPIPTEYQQQALYQLPPNKQYVALVVGAGKPWKCWPLENFVQVALHLQRKGLTPCFILGPQEKDWYNTLSKKLPDAVYPLQQLPQDAPVSPFQTIAIAGRCLAAIANDCGAGHMMAAASIPLVSLFGRTRAEKLAPLVPHSHVLKATDYGETNEMSQIPVAEVVQALDELLERANPTGQTQSG